jgi:WD40 repeat protein
VIIRREHDMVYGLAYSADGRLLASGGADRTAVVWQLPDVRPLRRLGPHDAEVWRVLFLGESLVCGTFAGKLVRWDLERDTLSPRERRQTTNGQIRTLVPDPDSDRFFVGVWQSVGYGGSSAWWRMEGGGKLVGDVLPVHGLPVRRLLVYGTVWTPEVNKPPVGGPNGGWLRTLQRFMAVAVGPGGVVAAVDEVLGGSCLFVIDGQTGRVRAVRLLRDQARAVAFVAGWLAVGIGNAVHLFDPATLAEGPVLRGHEDWVLGLAATPDGRSLLSASRDGSVRLWDARTWEEMNGWQWRLGTLWALAVAPDGMTAAAGGGSGEVVVWDLE